MTHQKRPALRRFTQSSPIGRNRAAGGSSSITVDEVEVTPKFDPPMVKLLTPQRAAALLGVNVRTLERWRITGEGPPFVRLTRSTVRYRLPELANFIASRLKKSTAQ